MCTLHLHRMSMWPFEVGRIPLWISSGLTGFTADQWKNWATIYSPFCIKGLIKNRHYDKWLDFVQVCIILCSRVISINRLEVAGEYLQTFLSKFVKLFGPLHCTPNMHLHLQLKECMLDCGPVYSYWCFSFERFTGQLKSRLWGRANSFICHGHVNMVLNLTVF